MSARTIESTQQTVGMTRLVIVFSLSCHCSPSVDNALASSTNGDKKTFILGSFLSAHNPMRSMCFALISGGNSFIVAKIGHTVTLLEFAAWHPSVFNVYDKFHWVLNGPSNSDNFLYILPSYISSKALILVFVLRNRYSRLFRTSRFCNNFFET